MRATHHIKPFRIHLPSIEKALQRVTCIIELAGSDVGGANLAPDFMLGVAVIAGHNLLEMGDRIRPAVLRARDSTQLVMRVNFIGIDMYRALEALARLIQLAALLVDQSQ